jgi:predicted enzyme related to lactoylglutathione lyase
MTPSPRFVWHDLLADDIEGAKRFYGELFGWRFKKGESDESYEHVYAGETAIGGIMKNPSPIPPHWLAYVGVDDVDASVAAVTSAGGRRLSPTTDMPTVGQFAAVADPTGAAFSPFHYTGKDAGRPESNEPPALWTFCWNELLSSEPERAAKFYAQAFGWDLETMEMPGYGTYTLLKRRGVKDATGADKSAGGVGKLPPGVPRSFWLPYVAVSDCDATVAKAQRLGAKIPMPAMDIPNVGRFATIIDPQMAATAVLQPQR